MNDLKPGPLKADLQAGYEAVDFLLHRPFLQYVLTQLNSSEFTDGVIPSSIASRAQRAIEIGIKHVSVIRTLPLIDFFCLKQVILATLLVISASKLMGTTAVTEDEVMDTLNGATEVLARTAKTSESAKRALQLISEIRVGMKSNGA
jgi:hypothetical protein